MIDQTETVVAQNQKLCSPSTPSRSAGQATFEWISVGVSTRKSIRPLSFCHFHVAGSLWRSVNLGR